MGGEYGLLGPDDPVALLVDRRVVHQVGVGADRHRAAGESRYKVEPNVKIVARFPEDSHPPIVYPVALTANAKPDAAKYIAFMRSSLAKTIFETYGFTFLIKPTT